MPLQGLNTCISTIYLPGWSLLFYKPPYRQCGFSITAPNRRGRMGDDGNSNQHRIRDSVQSKIPTVQRCPTSIELSAPWVLFPSGRFPQYGSFPDYCISVNWKPIIDQTDCENRSDFFWIFSVLFGQRIFGMVRHRYS